MHWPPCKPVRSCCALHICTPCGLEVGEKSQAEDQDEERSERGSAVVETALVMMLLMTILLAVFQFSIAYYAYDYVTYAARDAARFAIVRGSSCSGLSGGCPASANDIQDYLRSNTFPGINPNSMTVSTSWPSAQSQCSPSQNPCNNPGNLVQISVSYTLKFSIPPLGPWTRTLNATSVMVISQ